MANPSAAHEPSMEEILASIRQIISEDGEGAQASESVSAKDNDTTGFDQTPAEPEAVEPEPEEPESDPFAAAAHEEPASHFEAPQSFEAAPEFEPESHQDSAFAHGEPMTPQHSTARAEPESFGSFEQPAPKQPAPQQEGRHLLSQDSDQAVHGAFSALAHTILAQNARTLEDLVAEMLQPMLKNWLDENLPALVERLVQDEIQRVSRGRP